MGGFSVNVVPHFHYSPEFGDSESGPNRPLKDAEIFYRTMKVQANTARHAADVAVRSAKDFLLLIVEEGVKEDVDVLFRQKLEAAHQNLESYFSVLLNSKVDLGSFVVTVAWVGAADQ